MSAALRRFKERCEGHRLTAWRESAADLRPRIGVDFRVNGWSRGALQAYQDQWASLPRREGVNWDWEDAFRQCRDPDSLEVTVWVEDQLCGIGLGTVSNNAIFMRYMEARPDAANPLVGQICLIIMDVAARYGQLMGRTEIRCEPLNDMVAGYFKDTFGFRLVTPRKGVEYYALEI